MRTTCLAVLLVLCDLSGNAATVIPASLERADVAAAAATLNNDDIFQWPSGSPAVPWTTPVTVNKHVIIQSVSSGSTTITCNMPTGGGDPTTMSALIFTPSTLGFARLTGINFSGTGVGGCGVLCQNVRVDHCTFDGFAFGTYAFGYGLQDHNTYKNNFTCRVYGDGTGLIDWNNNYPIAFDSLNYMFFENCTWIWDNSYWHNGFGHAHVSSGQGSSYVVRFSTSTASIDAFEPAFDWHGDNNDGTYGNLNSQVYANTFTLTGTASMDKAVDARGGNGAVYSNSWSGVGLGSERGVAVREEWPLQFPVFINPHMLVTNMWVWTNTVNGAIMPTFVDDTTGLIHLGTEYFVQPFTPYRAPQYPHPWDTNTVVNIARVTNLHVGRAKIGP